MTSFRPSAGYKESFAQLRKYGLLLLQDRSLPSVVGILAGGPIVGSWWGHPQGRAIYAASTQLTGHPDVLTAKLLSGKVTFIHRTLWSAFLAVAAAAAPWQMEGLTPAARTLLRRVLREGTLDARTVARAGARSPRETVSELERRLLVRTIQVHTPSGAHARELESWPHWMGRVAWAGPAMDPGAGRLRLVEAVRRMCRDSGGRCALPWEE